MSVTVASCTLAEIFDAHINNTSIIASGNREISGELTIPEYQRPYRWQQAQVERLLNDYQQYLAEVADSSSSYGYYLGSLILHQAAKDKRLNIIDGQQRLTTLALINYVRYELSDAFFDLSLSYESPESHKQIVRNLVWLRNNASDVIKTFDPSKINLTLVVTNSEDEAYRFFETQNTGGVRLKGPDIIKASHLRSLGDDVEVRNAFALKWEALGNLNPVVGSLIKGRYWKKIKGQAVPSYRMKQAVRDSIVSELDEKTGKGDDVAYGRTKRTNLANGCQLDEQVQQGYDLRQPLNSGVNTIHYIRYFEGLRFKYLNVCEKKAASKSALGGFHNFYQNLVCNLDGCSFLKELYDTSLLIYISQFGERDLDVAAKKLFRVIYSCRVSNKTTVREDSVSSFVREYPVLDWIALSYTPEMCFEYLDHFVVKVNESNLDTKNGVKKRFVRKVLRFFADTEGEELKDLSAAQLAQAYQKTLANEVVALSSSVSKQEVTHGR
ncbi:DUF262 domain-containing protein [Leucothrix sargassi]|nr:DUF262 domain-containing protein [Leucothrix sargassi]